ncbi:glutamine-rich protein 2-like [Struthio camelus]|uniref:glutamine-rich protein 2-like n=1 Tax=Struthio camelus TaxID=8801 RepID=UPI003603FFF8
MLRERIQAALEELTAAELRHLKAALGQVPLAPGYAAIARSRLEPADVFDLTDLLVGHYCEAYGAAVAAAALRRVRRLDLAEPLAAAAAAAALHGGFAHSGALHWGFATPGALHWGIANLGALHGGFAHLGALHWGFATPGALHGGFANLGALHWGIATPGALHGGFAHLGALHGGFAHSGALHGGIANLGALHWGFATPGALHGGFAHLGALHWGFAHLGALHWGFAHLGALHWGFAIPGALHGGFAHSGASPGASGPAAAPSPAVAGAAVAQPPAAAAAARELHFVERHRAELIQRVPAVEPLLDLLLGEVLDEEQARAVAAEGTPQAAMRRLLGLAPAWTPRCKDRVAAALRRRHPALVAELEARDRGRP